MAAASKRFVAYNDGNATITANYDDVTLAVASVDVVNNTAFDLWVQLTNPLGVHFSDTVAAGFSGNFVVAGVVLSSVIADDGGINVGLPIGWSLQTRWPAS